MMVYVFPLISVHAHHSGLEQLAKHVSTFNLIRNFEYNF